MITKCDSCGEQKECGTYAVLGTEDSWTLCIECIIKKVIEDRDESVVADSII